MSKISLKKIKEIVQRVLDCTLWGHFPYESMNIIKEKSLKNKIEIYEELLRQRLKLQKQLNKVNCAYNIALGEILQDRNSATDQHGKRFRSPDICVDARYILTKDFVDHILANIKDCKIDPDTITDIVLDIPYVIDYDNPYEHMEITKISDVKDALSDLWFVSSIQPVYNKEKISQFICKCNLRVNGIEETEDQQPTQETENDPEVGKTDNFSGVEEAKSGEAEQLKKAILYHNIPNMVVDPTMYIKSFRHEDVVACTVQIFNELVSIMISEKQLSKAISKLFIHEKYCNNNKALKYEQVIKEKVLQVSEMFLDQIVSAIDNGEVNRKSIKFCTVIKYDLSKADKEITGTKYAEIISAFNELWFVKNVYPHYGLDGIDSVMIVCETPINKGAEQTIKSYKAIACKISNCFYDFCRSMESRHIKLCIDDAVYKIIQKAAMDLAAYDPIGNTNVSFDLNFEGILKIDVNNLSCSIDSRAHLVDIKKYIEHTESLSRYPIMFVTPEFHDSSDKGIINFTLSIFYKV